MSFFGIMSSSVGRVLLVILGQKWGVGIITYMYQWPIWKTTRQDRLFYFYVVCGRIEQVDYIKHGNSEMFIKSASWYIFLYFEILVWVKRICLLQETWLISVLCYCKYLYSSNNYKITSTHIARYVFETFVKRFVRNPKTFP